jgi:hypothetical protein
LIARRLRIGAVGDELGKSGVRARCRRRRMHRAHGPNRRAAVVYCSSICHWKRSRVTRLPGLLASGQHTSAFSTPPPRPAQNRRQGHGAASAASASTQSHFLFDPGD